MVGSTPMTSRVGTYEGIPTILLDGASVRSFKETKTHFPQA